MMSKYNTFIALDPSLAAFGIAIIDENSKQIILDQRKADSHHDFVLMSWSIANLYNSIFNTYKTLINKKDTFIAQEAPIASGINSGKLNALGMYFYINLGSFSSYESIRTFHPIKLKVFHHKKSYNKKDTINVVTDILEYMESKGYSVKMTVSRTKKSLSITDGEADAFMYAIASYITYIDNDISKYLWEKYPRFDVIKSIEEVNHGRK